MWGECIGDVAAGKGFPAWQQDYMEFMFYANDTSGKSPTSQVAGAVLL